MATGGQETASAGPLLNVPAILPVPRANSMVIVDFPVMDGAEQALVDDGLGRLELVRKPRLEADAGSNARFLDRLLHGVDVL